MTAELGVIFLIVALLTSAFQSCYLHPKLRPYITPCMQSASWLQGLAITLALTVLITLRLNNDFSVTNVIAHSNLSLPVLYKITGAWGNHEGSMLLWAWVVAIFGLTLLTRERDDTMVNTAGAIQAALCAGVLAFILFTSNPFARSFPPMTDGQMLNPILQDIALAIHPPLLYLGYVGFSVVFSLAVAAMLKPIALREWAVRAHPWILAAWSALTLGIGLGSWWAYRELGWGGWWFWDPVENASLLPWLSGTALLHSNIALKKRGVLGSWVLLLAIITFGLSLIGTFLVRSGALTSVHSFVSDPLRGLFILAYIVITIGGALALYALRSGRMETQEAFTPASREGMIVINNLFLLTACATVLLGTLYPLLAEWLQDSKLTVGPPYFNKTFLPLMAIPLMVTGFALYVPWKQTNWQQSARRARPALLAAFAVAIIAAAMTRSDMVFAAFGFSLAAWVGASSLHWLIQHKHAQSRYSVFLGHFGAALMVAGITGVGLWKSDTELWMNPGAKTDFAGYSVIYTNDRFHEEHGYKAHSAELRLEDRRGNVIATLIPEYRRYGIRAITTSEAAIVATGFRDIVAVIGETSDDGKRTAVRLYSVPMIRFIWAGFVLMALGGIVGVARRYG